MIYHHHICIRVIRYYSYYYCKRSLLHICAFISYTNKFSWSAQMIACVPSSIQALPTHNSTCSYLLKIILYHAIYQHWPCALYCRSTSVQYITWWINTTLLSLWHNIISHSKIIVYYDCMDQQWMIFKFHVYCYQSRLFHTWVHQLNCKTWSAWN